MTNDSFYLGIQKERGLDGEFPFWCSVTPLLHRTQKGRFFAERSGRAERLLCTFCYGVNNFVWLILQFPLSGRLSCHTYRHGLRPSREVNAHRTRDNGAL